MVYSITLLRPRTLFVIIITLDCLLSLLSLFVCFFLYIATRLSSVVGLHVIAEKKRLEEAKLIAESEKTTYVKVNSSGMLPWNVQFDLI